MKTCIELFGTWTQQELRAGADLSLRQRALTALHWTISLALALLSWPTNARAQTLTPSQQFQDAIHFMETKGDYAGAIKLFEEIAKGPDRALAARALLHLGFCYEKLGKEIARAKYEQLIHDFPDQKKLVEEARSRLAALNAARAPGHATLQIRRILAEPSSDEFAAVSPDGRYLSFHDSGDLGLLEIATGQKRQLAVWDQARPNESPGFYSVFAPDSQQLAYGWTTGDHWELRTIGVDGAGIRTVCQRQGLEDLEPTGWSRDGRFILAHFSRGRGGDDIVLVNVADGSVRVLKTLQEQFPDTLRLSPDSRYVAYQVLGPGELLQSDIFLLPTDGGPDVPLVQHPAMDSVLGWTPDGKRLLFASDRTGSTDAWMIEVAEGKPKGPPELLTRDLGRVGTIGLTRKGSFYYRLQTGMKDIAIATLDAGSGKAAGEPRMLSHRYAGTQWAPTWSRDGRQLAFISQRGRHLGYGSRFLVFRSLDTGEERELSPKMKWLNHLRVGWAPDGRSILDTGDDFEGRAGIHQIDVRTGEVGLIYHEPHVWVFQALWSPDGKWIYYNVADHKTKTHHLMARESATGQTRELFQTDWHVSLIRHDLSPDGRTIALVHGGVLKIMPAAGGETRDLYTFKKPEYSLDLVWMPDGKHLLFSKLKGPTPQDYMASLWRIAASGGEPEDLGITMDIFSHVTPSPDGRRIAYVTGQDKTEVWVMENFLPPLAKGE